MEDTEEPRHGREMNLGHREGISLGAWRKEENVQRPVSISTDKGQCGNNPHDLWGSQERLSLTHAACIRLIGSNSVP